MISTRLAAAAMMPVALVVLTACGGSSGGGSASTPAGAPASTAAPSLTDQQTPPAQVVIDVSIKGGQVTPTNKAVEAKVGEPIVLHVDSDAADELHVHSVPEHEFEVEPKAGQTFQFTVEVPGRVDIELHKTDRTVATVTVT